MAIKIAEFRELNYGRNFFNKAFKLLKDIICLFGIADVNSFAEPSKDDLLAATVIVMSCAVVIFVTRLMADRGRHNITPKPMDDEDSDEG